MNFLKKAPQPWFWLLVIAFITTVLATLLLWNKPSPTADQATSEADQKTTAPQNLNSRAANEAEDSLEMSMQQIQAQNIQLEQVSVGSVQQVQRLPARLLVNTDRQAHVSPSFAGRVESVYVELGQSVKRGQALADLLVPDLVDQQANLHIAQSNLALAQQDYERERRLWTQGISAKQDYQRAENAYRLAQIQVQAARSRLSAFGATPRSNGRYTLTAPISGVVSNKDIVVGENVQLSDQLFTIDQLDQLWLEFILPTNNSFAVQPEQRIVFTSLQTGNSFSAQIQSLTAQADTQTGRLQVRAKVLSQASELRPNLMVNVELATGRSQPVTRVSPAAIQQVESKDVVFVVEANADKFTFRPVAVQLGQRTADGQWVEIIQGLKAGQRYVSTGSFVLKSELEKGEADHGH